MKTLQLKLQGNEAVALNDPVYLEANEKIEFIVTNGEGELFFSTNGHNEKIEDGRFEMTAKEFKNIENLNIIEKTTDKAYPKLYRLVLKRHDITVLGRTVDERWPQVIKDLAEQLNTQGRAILDLYDKLEEKEKEGVIE